MENQPSPRKVLGVGPSQNFTHSDSPYTDYRSSRSAIKAELPGKLVFDDGSVFRRLGIQDVPENFVNECSAKLKHAKADAIEKLQKIVADAQGKEASELEEEINVRDDEGNRRKVKKRELDMYPHLKEIFNFIEDYGGSRQYLRHFVPTNHTVLTAEKHTYGFPPSSPDFTLMNMAVTTTLWRDRLAFAETKPSTKQGPKPSKSDETVILPIVSQCADYARLHLSARPFQLFSVGLLIFGHHFCVGIFDRAGITFSTIYDMWEHTETFVRVVRRLSCDLSAVELGQDPTIMMLPDADSVSMASQANAFQLIQDRDQDFPTFPAYGISMGGKDNRLWCTVGPPIWNSLSFLGRGTSIWRVSEVKDGQLSGAVMVMKCAWRSSKRAAEASIYQNIKGTHPGVATYLFGGDVRLSNGDIMTVNSLRLRQATLPPDKVEETPVLHRLFLSTVGRPLWEYRSEVELLKGLRAALRGHEFLFKQGILHRDISGGNILLSASPNPNPGCEGFITDLDLARVGTPTLNTVDTVKSSVDSVRGPSGIYTQPTTRTHSKFETVSVPHGAAMSGTVQFMAVEILDGIIYHSTVTHHAHHDIESFIWVLCYSISRQMDEVSRRSQQPSELRKSIRSFFFSRFGRVDLDAILNSRSSRNPLYLGWKVFKDGFFSVPMIKLFEDLDGHVQLSHLRQERAERLTHDMILARFDQTVEKLENL
ncbi:hypothetical protein BD410DRAFT_899351 [Rickenella mellea]|uniref:Protein kinase domain-containing protein n=1 Tax=Rickenella mellea TaxID=50990 RepID=A0A4Y7PZN9_9AGAM|nr:hypothetical protein BD410DRAFT_899351 [Rickenella mellea]